MTRAAANDEDPVICMCCNMRRSEILDYMAQPGSSYDSLTQDLGVGGKCTACRMDLEMLLGQPLKFTTVGRRSDLVGAGFGRTRADQLNCGFLRIDDEVETLLRLANPPQPNGSTDILADYALTLAVFDAEGRERGRWRGALERGAGRTIDLREVAGPVGYGWFTVDATAKSAGLAGNIRPQVLLKGRGWAAPYHAQLVSMASKLRSVMVASRDGRTGATFPVLNTGRTPAKMTVSLFGTAGPLGERRTAVPAEGLALFDVDDAFAAELAGHPRAILTAVVTTSLPTRRYILVRQDDGAYSVDHFPNTR